MDQIEDDEIKILGQKTEGFSAREIEKFVIACHDTAFSKKDPILDKETLN